MKQKERVGIRLDSRDLLITLIERKIRLFSKRSLVGVTFPLVAPLIIFCLYIFVFHEVFSSQIFDYPIYLFAGLLPWTYLAQSLGDAVTSVSSEFDLIRRSPFRYELLPVATVAAYALYFLVSLFGFIVILAAIGRLNPVALPVLVLPVACLFLLVATISMVLALIDVYHRDLRRFLGNLLTIWFFIIPIVYSQSRSKALEPLRYVDPANILISEFRAILYYQSLPPAHTLISGLAICLAIFGAALYLYRRFDDRIARDV